MKHIVAKCEVLDEETALLTIIRSLKDDTHRGDFGIGGYGDRVFSFVSSRKFRLARSTTSYDCIYIAQPNLMSSLRERGYVGNVYMPYNSTSNPTTKIPTSTWPLIKHAIEEYNFILEHGRRLDV